MRRGDPFPVIGAVVMSVSLVVVAFLLGLILRGYFLAFMYGWRLI